MPSAVQAAHYEELAFLDLINAYRAEKGLGELILSDKLTGAAFRHSFDMASKDYFSHESLDGSGFADRIRATGYPHNTYLGENIAAGRWRAADVLDTWRSSPGHNGSLLGENFKAIGISRVFTQDSRYNWYWTVTFGGIIDSSMSAAKISETDNWAYDNIRQLADQGIISGYPDGTFRPENPITRAEFAAIMIRALDISKGGSKIFSDTKHHWANDYIAPLADRGYIDGYGDGSFRPDNLLTRAEMVKIITKAGGLKLQSGTQSFSDISGHWARDYIVIASSNGVINGYPDGKFRPDAYCLRSETATCVYRLISAGNSQ